MELPFELDWTPPRLTRWDLLRNRFFWLGAVAVCVAFAVLALTHPWAPPSDVPPSVLVVSSVPAGATVTVDGRDWGHTPLDVRLAPGSHEVSLQRARYVEMTYRLALASGARVPLQAVLWQQVPMVTPLRSPPPGAQVVDVTLLSDGRVTLTLGLPSGDERQLWLLGANQVPRSIGPPYAEGAIASTVDGKQIAYLARSADNFGLTNRLDQIWVSRQPGSPGQRRYVLTAKDQQFTDLSWAPGGQRLLLVVERQQPAGGVRDQLWLLPAASGEPRVLDELPSVIVPGSFAWIPNGHRVAFLARADGHVALCLLDVRDGSLRDLAELPSGASPPFPPFAWSTDGARLLFSAPVSASPSLGGWLFGTPSQSAPFVVDAHHPLGAPLGATDVSFAIWRDDGSLLGLTRRGNDGRLTLRLIDPDGQAHDLATLPIQSAANFGVRWDVAHGQAIVAVSDNSSLGESRFTYWLVRFQPEGAR